MHQAKERMMLRVPRHDILLTIGGKGKIGAMAVRHTLRNGIRIKQQSAISAVSGRIGRTTSERAHNGKDEQQGGSALLQAQTVHGRTILSKPRIADSSASLCLAPVSTGGEQNAKPAPREDRTISPAQRISYSAATSTHNQPAPIMIVGDKATFRFGSRVVLSQMNRFRVGKDKQNDS
jgi:hypothetical protein